MYKDNHYIPQVYTKGFLDPITPERQIPFVWLYDADSKSVRNKAPKNILAEKDLYTQYDKDLNRICDLEKYFNQNIETPFIQFKNKFEISLQNCDTNFLWRNYNKADHLFIARFIQWQLLRTLKMLKTFEEIQREVYSKCYPELLEIDPELMKEYFQNELMNSLMTEKKNPEGKTFLRCLVEKSVHFTVITSEDASFISSDNPVLSTNPNFKNGQPVDDPETEFTIPLTSKIAVSLYKYDHNFTFRTMQNRIEIENINQSFAKNAYNTIFGSSKELIESLVKLIPMKKEL